jgi:hypothetical protein
MSRFRFPQLLFKQRLVVAALVALLLNAPISATRSAQFLTRANRNPLQAGTATPLAVAVVTPSLPLSAAAADIGVKLRATGAFASVALVDAVGDKPSLAELQSYAAVLVYMDPNSYFTEYNATTLGNTLAEYVDGGGGVVVMDGLLVSSVHTPLQGRFLNEGYYAIDANGSRAIAIALPRASLGTVYAPQHPVLHHVNSFREGNTYRSNGVISRGACVLAAYSDGRPLVVEKEVAGGHRRIDLNFFPPSSDTYPHSGPTTYWDSRTDGAQLMANALRYVATRVVAPQAMTCSLTGAGLPHIPTRSLTSTPTPTRTPTSAPTPPLAATRASTPHTVTSTPSPAPLSTSMPPLPATGVAPSLGLGLVALGLLFAVGGLALSRRRA